MQLLLRPDALIGRKYRLLRPLGMGGMGEVWSARNIMTERDFALKILRADLAVDPDAVQRFLREAKAAGRLRHPQVVEVYDVGRVDDPGQSDGVPYLVMELLEGEGLDAILRRRRRLPLDAALAFAHDIACGLDFAHRAGVVHRDLKPGNLFVQRRGADAVPKILDFGLSKLAGASVATSLGAVIGSPAYMSPEQATADARIDHRTDIWSFGVVLYKCLTGELPFRGDTPNLLMMAITDGQPQPLVEGASHVPAEVQRIIGRCLEKSPERRFSSAGELADALARARTGREIRLISLLEPARDEEASHGVQGDEETTMGALASEAPRRRSRASRTAALALALVGLVAAAGTVAHRLRPSRASAANPASTPPRATAEARTPTPTPASMPTPAPSSSAATELSTASAPAPSAAASPSTRKPPRSRPARGPAAKPAARSIDKPDF